MRIALVIGAIWLALGLSPAFAQEQVKPLRIGVLGDMGGLGSSFGGPGSVAAAKLAAEDFGSKVLGRPVEILSGDHQNKPDIASSIANRWFDVENVAAIADLPQSASALAVMGVAKAAKRTTLVSGATTVDITGKACSPFSSHWSDDNYTLVNGLGRLAVKTVGKTWYFVVLDQIFGQQILATTSEIITREGGAVLGSSKNPMNTSDFSSYILLAQASKAAVIGLANVGSDLTNFVKQAAEFGVMKGGQKIVAFLPMISDVHELGLETAQGMILLANFYWDQGDESRAFADRFFKVMQRMPTKEQAAVYASVKHYLAAIKDSGTDDAATVNAKMRLTPVDFLGRPGSMRADGRVLVDVTLYQVKQPNESSKPWDYYKPLATMPKEEAYHPIDSSCAF